MTIMHLFNLLNEHYLQLTPQIEDGSIRCHEMNSFYLQCINMCVNKF